MGKKMEFDADGRIIVPGESPKEPKILSKNTCWSLYKQKEDDDADSGNIFSFSGDKLPPLKFSNGKTQEDVVKEILDAIHAGTKIIFIKGVCGSGKSAIALNLAKHFKKSSIVVPIKNLQDQYEADYTNKNYILKEDGKKLKISVLKGRANFACLYEHGETADYDYLPCTIELREKNFNKILEYINENEDVKKEDFSSVSDVKRVSVAPACPHWCPLMPADMGGKTLSKAKKRKYQAINGKEYALFQRTPGCRYYEQYGSYIDADVLIFNSQKYLLEVSLGRKPITDLDIVDECDEFLDSFANEKKINLNKLITALSTLSPADKEDKQKIKQLILLANKVQAFYTEEIVKLEASPLLELFDKILDCPYLAEDEDRSYYNTVFEGVKSFESLVAETYVCFEKTESEQKGLFETRGDNIYVNLVSINVAKRFKELAEKSSAIVLMSGTLHSETVLKDIFGLNEFKVIEAETKSPGKITKVRKGFEKNCRFENFKLGNCTREWYLKALSACVSSAKNPTLIHVSSFGDLPTSEEKKTLHLDNLISKEELFKLQDGKNPVNQFKKGEIDLLFSTKCSRGVDFPGDQCNSIILTKFPYPNIQGIFWKILKKEQPTKFMEFYMDKARRELIQKVARGVRFTGDHVFLLSPDSRVLEANFN